MALSGAGARIALTSADMVGIAILYFLEGEPLLGITPDTMLIGFGLVATGLLFLLVASGIALVNPYGGPLMFIATAISSLGLTVMRFSTAPFGGPFLFTVDYGALLAFSGATLAIVGLLLHRAEFRGPTEPDAPTQEPPAENG